MVKLKITRPSFPFAMKPPVSEVLWSVALSLYDEAINDCNNEIKIKPLNIFGLKIFIVFLPNLFEITN